MGLKNEKFDRHAKSTGIAPAGPLSRRMVRRGHARVQRYTVRVSIRKMEYDAAEDASAMSNRYKGYLS